MVTGWAEVAPRASGGRMAASRSSRSASATMSSQGPVLDELGVVAERPGDGHPTPTRSTPSGDTSMMTDPALCTSERKRASWP